MKMLWVLACVTLVLLYNDGVSSWLITAPMPPPIRDGETPAARDMAAIFAYPSTPLSRKPARISPAEREKNYRLGLLLLHMCNNPELAKFPFSDEFWGQLADMIQRERLRLTAKGTTML